MTKAANFSLNIFAIFLFLSGAGLCSAEQSKVQHPIKTKEIYSSHHHCPNCGMNINAWARTRHELTLNHKTIQTCSIRCVADLGQRNNTAPVDSKVAIYHNPKEMISTSNAWYVVGSTAIGTMTNNSKIAFATEEVAQSFSKSAGGKVVNFDHALKVASKEVPISRPKIDAKRLKKGKVVGPTATDSCNNCGMYPARYPNFKSQAKEDGQLHHFCSTKCLVVSQQKGKKLTSPWVTLYNTSTYEFAEGLWFVSGSNVHGPMGQDFHPFRNKKDAKEFANTNGGMVLTYQEALDHLARNKSGCPMDKHQHNHPK